MSSRPGRRGLPAVLAASVSVAALAACPSPRAPAVSVPEPIAAQKPHEVTSPHGARIDPYYWLRDDTRKDPEVLAYLEAENRYAQAALAPVQPLERTLRAEMTARVAQEDASAPVLRGGWWYIQRWEPERQYPILVRDGFVGNIALKLIEGLAEGLFKTISKEIALASPELARSFEPVIKRVWANHDYAEYGGAPLLGIDGACIICHGSSNHVAIRNAIRVAVDYLTNDLNSIIAAELSKEPTPTPEQQ